MITGAGHVDDRVYVALEAPGATNADVTFPVEDGARTILATLTWTTATSDLDPWLAAPDFEQYPVPEVSSGGIRGSEGHFWIASSGGAGAGDPGVTLRVDVEPDLLGVWRVGVVAELATQEAFALAVEVHYSVAAP